MPTPPDDIDITRALGRIGRDASASLEMDAALAAVQSRIFKRNDAAPVLGGYRIEHEIGRGGMGIVYAARDLAADRRVAVKVMRVPESGAVRFRREFQTLARLEHPRVVAVYDFGQTDRHLYYAMELLEGADLPHGSRAEDAVARSCAIVRDIASALAMLHARRLLHGDLSPRNIRCTPSGAAKLIDFGLLSTMGPSHEIAGTPPCLAPECLMGLPLDQRADLFGLGAVFYWLLAGRHAFPARTLEDRIAALRSGTTPPPLREVAPHVPAGIDALVMSMLATDRQARPHTAADVIDRVCALVELPPAPELDIARGYVRSAALIGRGPEMQRLRELAELAANGRGSTVLLRGRTGAGKSRLLRELGLDAKLQGTVVVHVPMDTRGRGPFEALRRVVAELDRALPELVERTARPRIGLLAAAIPELRRFAPDSPPRVPLSDPREQRLLLQREVTDWLAELSSHHTFALLLDDVQRCDESSAAVLLALARRIERCRILVAASVREDEPPLADAAIAALGRVAESIAIKGLDAGDLETLVRASFGDVPGVARLAEFLRAKTGGSPLLATDLLGALVDDGRIVYGAGLWIIADDVDAAALPESLQASCDAQVSELGTRAREVAELLAVHGGPASLETCVALVGDETEAFAAIDELLEHEILVVSRFAHEFRHDGVKEAILRRIDHDRRRSLHARVGRVLDERALPGHDRDAEVGWHLVAGGDEHAGARRLETAGRRLFESTAFGDAIRPLSTTLDVYERSGLHADRQPELYYMLALSGFFADHDVAGRSSPRALQLLAQHSGIGRIRRLQRVLGAPVGFVGGIVEAAIRRRTSAPDRRGPSPKHALSMFAHTAIMSGGLSLAKTEREKLVELRELVAPLAKIRIGNLDRIFRFITMMEAVTFGRFGEVRRTAGELLAEAAERRTGSWASEFEVRVFHGAVRFIYGLALAHSDRDRALENIEALERLDVKVWELGAQQLRQGWHLRRGETRAAQEILARLELGYVELGSVWQIELGLAPGTALARALVGDVLGLRRSIDQLRRLVDRGLGYNGALDLARADYHRERGELDVALAAVDRALVGFANGGWGRGWGLTCRAHVLLDAGRLDEAARAVADAMKYVADPVHRDDGVYFRCARVEALIHAERGDVTRAVRLLDRLVVEAAPSENPAYLGLIHEAAAIVATKSGDAVAFDRHRRMADAWFRCTDNPVLIGRLERIDGGASTSATASARVAVQTDSAETVVTTREREPSTDEAPVRTSPLDATLERLVEWSDAVDGFLFLVEDGRIVLAAPQSGDPPPPGLEQMLERALERGLGWQEVHRGEDGTYRALVLRLGQDLDERPVAVAALRAGAVPLHPPDLARLRDLADMLAPPARS